MKISNIYMLKEGFEVLHTAKHSQTAMMILDVSGQSSEALNTHEESDQVLLVLEGKVEGEIGGEDVTLHRGDTCIVPAGTPHRFKNGGKTRALTFNVYSPPEYSPNEKD